MQKHVREQISAWRRARNRKAMRDFATFLVGLVAIGLAFELFARMQWLHNVNSFWLK